MLLTGVPDKTALVEGEGRLKVLIVEDDRDTVYLVSTCLNLRWPQATVISAGTGEEGFCLSGSDAPDLVIIDIGLPDIDGRDLLRRTRDFSDVPIMMLTARDRDLDIAASLEAGADDYVTKPFSSVELLARVQAVIRRSRGRMGSVNPPLTAGDLLLDFDGAEVCRGGDRVELTLTEMRILQDLTRNALRVVSYDSLANRVLDVEDPGDSERRLIRVHGQHLRSKLGDAAQDSKYIANVRGVGYKFVLEVNVLAATGV